MLLGGGIVLEIKFFFSYVMFVLVCLWNLCSGALDAKLVFLIKYVFRLLHFNFGCCWNSQDAVHFLSVNRGCDELPAKAATKQTTVKATTSFIVVKEQGKASQPTMQS